MSHIEQDADARDAQRYRWLRSLARSTALHMDGTAYWFLTSAPFCYVRTETFDEAVDAARAKEKDDALP